jgi:phenylacetic acid degradation operon negative regulatory protein
MAKKQTSIGDWIKRSLREDPPRSKSLIVTIFGDSLLPYVPGVWLSELTELLRPFHVNAQLARTSGFRLAEEGWLESHREGRRSRYSLTNAGRQRVEHAYSRIYDPPPKEWDGQWTLVFLSKAVNPLAERAELRRELEWEGFGMLSTGIFIHPQADLDVLNEVLNRLGLAHSVVVLQAQYSDAISSRAAPSLAAECWNLKLVEDNYARFLQRFLPVLPLIQNGMSPQTAFTVQTLLIHSFRRVVLHDPRLPATLLPANWPGHAAYDLCRNIYRQTFKETLSHLAEHIEKGKNKSFEPAAEFGKRLGGLEMRDTVRKT